MKSFLIQESKRLNNLTHCVPETHCEFLLYVRLDLRTLRSYVKFETEKRKDLIFRRARIFLWDKLDRVRGTDKLILGY